MTEGTCRHALLLLPAIVAACATTPFHRPVEFRGTSSASAAQRDEILWALQPYATAASGCVGPITGVDARAAAAAPGAPGQSELWIVYLCTTALPVAITLRPQPDGKLAFAFDTAR